MNRDKLYLTLDSKEITTTPQDLVVQLSQEINYTRVWLKNVDVQANRIRASDKRLYVHCSILNKDDNLLNGEKSDVVGILYRHRSLGFKLGNTGPKLIIPHSNSIRMYLTDDSNTIIEPFGANLIITYDLEFSNY